MIMANFTKKGPIQNAIKDKGVVLMQEKNRFNGFGKSEGIEKNAEK